MEKIAMKQSNNGPQTQNRLNVTKFLPQTQIDLDKNNEKSPKPAVTEIICITTFPPRECGIATFSKDLQKVVNEKFGKSFAFKIYALEVGNSKFHYTPPIKGILNTTSALDFLQAAYHINSDPNVEMILVQHEFGLFQHNEHLFYEFLEHLDKPILITFHTVLPRPSLLLKEKVSTLASLSKGILVMTHTSAQILRKEYHIPSEKITVIAHGTHLVTYESKKDLKEKYQLKGKKVLSTFGLLGPGKSIETTLDALPEIIKIVPNVIFLIIGRTHPTLVKENGEDYRLFLQSKIASLGLQNHIRFIDAFVPLETLLEYLQLTDIYLFTSKDPHQAVSGTFAYALSCGCPIISTPIPHALEVLKNEAGIIVDFQNAKLLQEAVIKLLQNKEIRLKMSLNGLHTSSASSWENVAIAHAHIFQKIIGDKLQLHYTKPPFNLNHIKRMTTPIGIIQFSKINHPNIETGYTLDDNARALVALCQHYKLTRDPLDLKYIKIYSNFIYSCFRHDGTFLNYVNKDYQFTEENDKVNLEDACGRAMWALGYFLSMAYVLPEHFETHKEKAKFIFEHSLKSLENVHSPRAMAFIIKGLYFYNFLEERECVNHTITIYADRLVAMYNHEHKENWLWFESYLTYGNSVLPQSLLMAYVMTLNSTYRKVAKESFDFLLSKIFKEDMIGVISNQKWQTRNDVFDATFKGGEQPIDVAYSILALRLFHKVFPFEGYEKLMETAFAWFLGKNPLQQTIYNPCTGGCYDGLELHNVNLNQGAESTLSYLLARMAFEDFDR